MWWGLKSSSHGYGMLSSGDMIIVIIITSESDLCIYINRSCPFIKVEARGVYLDCHAKEKKGKSGMLWFYQL